MYCTKIEFNDLICTSVATIIQSVIAINIRTCPWATQLTYMYVHVGTRAVIFEVN